MRWSKVSLPLVALSFLSFAAAADATKPSAPLPEGLPIEGKPVAHLRFSDKLGVHHVVVTETEVETKTTPEGDLLSTKRLFGYHFTRQAEQSDDAKSWKLLWRTRDFVTDCPLDLELAFVPGSLALSDVDGDGIVESRFAYRLGCFGDVSPLTMKLLFHEGEQKLAVRGSTRVEVGRDERGKPTFEGGERTLDPAFAKGPKGLASLAEQEWRRLRGP